MDKSYKQMRITDRVGKTTHLTDNRGNCIDFSGEASVFRTEWTVLHADSDGFIARLPYPYTRSQVGRWVRTYSPHYATPGGLMDTIELLDYLDDWRVKAHGTQTGLELAAQIIAKVLEYTEDMGLSEVLDTVQKERSQAVQASIHRGNLEMDRQAKEAADLRFNRLVRKWQDRLDCQPWGLVFKVKLSGPQGPQHTDTLEFLRDERNYILRFSKATQSSVQPVPYVTARCPLDALAAYLAITATGYGFLPNPVTAMTVPIYRNPVTKELQV
jgi:hypothetical protein